MARLSDALRPPAARLHAMTLKAEMPQLKSCDIAFTGAVKDRVSQEDHPNAQLRLSWRPLCLMEDRAGGGDHHLRLEWLLATSTMCQTHKRPLNERCQQCFGFVTAPRCALYGQQLAFVCPKSFTPLDARLGYDFVADGRAHRWNGDALLKSVWRKIAEYELWFSRTLRRRAAVSKKARVLRALRAPLDILLRAEPANSLRPVDAMESHYFPALTKLGFATRHLSQPFNICHLNERRKALAILVSLLEDEMNAFGFDTSASPLHRLREFMHAQRYAQFERHILDMARLALPI